jgi:hypothetical protein
MDIFQNAKNPNYPPKTAKYLLIFLIHNKKKKTFWTLEFRKNGFFVVWIFGCLDVWMFGCLDFRKKQYKYNPI